MFVKSFIRPNEEGTIISDKNIHDLPPIIVFKEGQVLVEISSRDFSFTNEGLTKEVNELLDLLKIKENLTQITAISLLCVVDDHPEKIEKLGLAASGQFEVQITKGLTLLTIRHYQENIIEELTKEKSCLLRQQTPELIQVLMR